MNEHTSARSAQRGLARIGLVSGPDLTYAAVVVPLIVAGIGCSLALPVVHNAVVGAVAPAEVGKASGANSMVQELGGVLGVAVGVATFAARGATRHRRRSSPASVLRWASPPGSPWRVRSPARWVPGRASFEPVARISALERARPHHSTR